MLSFRQKLHEDWLAVERNAQEEFERTKLEEERRKNERLEQEVLLIVRGAEEEGPGGSEPPSCDLMGAQPPNSVKVFGT